MRQKDFISYANKLGKENKPFLFIIDFETEKPLIFEIGQIPKDIIFNIKGFSFNEIDNFNIPESIILKKYPISYPEYLKAFNIVKQAIQNGETYLLNLTFKTPITINCNLKSLYFYADAKYKLYYKDQFVLFSPEPFVEVRNNLIFTYPMKGTISAHIPNAKGLLLQNKKELYEHYTVVDLLRNDLAMISEDVRVSKFRFVEEIETTKGKILQTSSEIIGKLPKNWNENIGNILIKLLPAGSVSGAPKKRTLQIIRQAEKLKRNYYTGIFGIYYEKTLLSAVNIRFIEKQNDKFFFRSGGGITAYSKPKDEYEEMITKIYVPGNNTNKTRKTQKLKISSIQSK